MSEQLPTHPHATGAPFSSDYFVRVDPLTTYLLAGGAFVVATGAHPLPAAVYVFVGLVLYGLNRYARSTVDGIRASQ